MRVSNRFLVLVVFLVSALTSKLASAQEPHSWCISGAPMIPNNSLDATTNKVIASVCGNTATANCCGRTGRWGLSCVQAGAVFAKQNSLSGGDFCGRYAWAQGPVGNQQYYPRDFNLFVTAGNVTGLRDVDGAVAASGTVSANSFNLNVRPREGIALLAGSVSLVNGSVNGSVVYGSGFGASGVTFITGARPIGSTNPFPINFQDASARLVAMSQAVARYDSAPAVKTNSTVAFTGSDPELNVFFLPTTMITGTTSYVYAVPAVRR